MPDHQDGDSDVLRVLARHGTPTFHTVPPTLGGNGVRCNCWSEARAALNGLRAAGYEVVRARFWRKKPSALDWLSTWADES